MNNYLYRKPFTTNKKLYNNVGGYQHNSYLFVVNKQEKCFVRERQIENYLNKELHLFDAVCLQKTVSSININPNFSFLLINATNKKYLKIESYSIKGYYGDLNFSTKIDSVHLLFYDTLDYVQCTRNNKYFKTRVDNQGFDRLGIDFKEPLFLDLPLFILIKDINKEQQELVDNRLRCNVTVNYDDLLKAKKDGLTRNDMLLKKYKRLSSLKQHFNFNKYKVFEIYTFLKLKPKLSEKEFERFIQWYSVNKRNVVTSNTNEYIEFFDYLYIYTEYLSGRFKRNFDEHYYEKNIIEDMFDLTKKIDCPMKSWNRFIKYHDELSIKSRNNLIKKRFNNKTIVLEEKWQPLIEKVKKEKNVQVLDSINKLIVEGNDMHHCVASYATKVAKGRCLILSIVLKGARYTVEVAIRGRKHFKYKAIQIQGKYNQSPTEVVVNEIRTLIEKERKPILC